MNKAILTSFIVLCLLPILFLMECKISVNADTDVIYVPTPDYPTIQEAINQANQGDTIFVTAGIYYEHVVVNKSVSLVGEDRDSTIVDGNATGNVISIEANNVKISGFTVRKSGPYYPDSGIYVQLSSGNDISHNTITNNNYDGISLYYSDNNVVSDNTITNNYNGISLQSSSNNVFSGNTISSNNYDGISLYRSSNNVVSDNTISSNIYNGISLQSSSNNVFSDNTITNNYNGISLDSSGNNVVSDNTITNNYNGISLYRSSNNVVSGNTISSNNHYGIYFALDSSNNIIYFNNFNNTDQVWSDSTNFWDDGDEGNYWSDYTGQDLNGDGIGDNPYVIDLNNQDNHPLMGMFSDFSVIHQEETYHVTTICNSTISEFRFEIGTETGNRIIRFNVTGKDITVGFCRVMIPTELMDYPYIVLFGAEEIVPTLLDVSNETHVYLFFTYIHSSHTITIISSKTLHLYNELLDKYVKLQIDLYNLNATYYDLLDNYSIFLDDFSQLQKNYQELNDSYQEHLNNYNILLGSYSVLIGDYSQLQKSYQELNNSYYDLLDNYSIFLDDFSQLQKNYQELNDSYQEHLSHYSKNMWNNRNLMYTLAAMTAIFIITTVYLSKHAHVGKTKVFEDRK